jgi:xanthine dehydrogenase large subunit
MNAPHPPWDTGHDIVGTAVAHDSATLHVTGDARYTDDVPEPKGTLHAALGVSPVAHGTIERLDLDPVRAAPDVVAVVSAADIPGVNDIGPIEADDPIFAGRIVAFAGQPVFGVAATGVKAARRAARLAVLDIAPLPAILTIDEALAAESYVLPPVHVVRGDVSRALAGAPHRLAGSLACGGQDHFYLEGQVALAIPRERDAMQLYVSTQHPGEVQMLVARALGLADHDVVVECRRMGGGFGGKETQMSLFACVAALLARKTGRAVKLRLDRDDDMRSTGKRHAFQYRYDAGFDAAGRILALDVTLASRCGFSADLSGPVNDRAVFHVDNAYWLPNVAIHSYRCRTNTVSDTAFRGFGGPQGMFAIETILDDIARSLGRDPLDVRKANLYGTTDRNVAPYGMVVEDNIAPALIDALEAQAAYRARRRDIAEWNRASPVVKRGIALTPVKFGISFTATHYNQAGALIHVYRDGTVLLNHGGTEMGQGLFVKVQQVVAQELGVPLAFVRVSASDTSKVPNASPTAASSGSDINGTAAHVARAACRLRRARISLRRGSHPFRRRLCADRRRPACLRGFDRQGVPRAHPVVGDGVLRDAEDSLRPAHADRPAVLLLRVRRRGERGRDRHAHRRAPAAGGGHPARCRRVAQSGDRPRPDRRRLHPGLGVADDGGARVESPRRARDARAVDVQDPDLPRRSRALRRPLLRRAEPRGDDPSLEGRR